MTYKLKHLDTETIHPAEDEDVDGQDGPIEIHSYSVHKDGKKVGEVEHNAYFGGVTGKIHNKSIPNIGDYTGDTAEDKVNHFMKTKTGQKWASNLHKYQKESVSMTAFSYEDWINEKLAYQQQLHKITVRPKANSLEGIKHFGINSDLGDDKEYAKVLADAHAWGGKTHGPLGYEVTHVDQNNHKISVGSLGKVRRAMTEDVSLDEDVLDEAFDPMKDKHPHGGLVATAVDYYDKNEKGEPALVTTFRPNRAPGKRQTRLPKSHAVAKTYDRDQAIRNKHAYAKKFGYDALTPIDDEGIAHEKRVMSEGALNEDSIIKAYHLGAEHARGKQKSQSPYEKDSYEHKSYMTGYRDNDAKRFKPQVRYSRGDTVVVHDKNHPLHGKTGTIQHKFDDGMVFVRVKMSNRKNHTSLETFKEKQIKHQQTESVEENYTPVEKQKTVIIDAPGHPLNGMSAFMFHKHADGRINVQVVKSSRKGDVSNLTLKPGQFKEDVDLTEARKAKEDDWETNPERGQFKVGDKVTNRNMKGLVGTVVAKDKEVGKYKITHSELPKGVHTVWNGESLERHMKEDLDSMQVIKLARMLALEEKAEVSSYYVEVAKNLLSEGRASQQHPLDGHDYHKKSEAELKYIIKDAGEAAKAMQGHSPKSEAKYLDQQNDAATVLGFRKRASAKTGSLPTWYTDKYLSKRG